MQSLILAIGNKEKEDKNLESLGFVIDAQGMLLSRKLCQLPLSQVTAITVKSFIQAVLDIFPTPKHAN